jgi:hypothetical protein
MELAALYGKPTLFTSEWLYSEDDQVFRTKSEAELVRRFAEFSLQPAPHEVSARPPHDP